MDGGDLLLLEGLGLGRKSGKVGIGDLGQVPDGHWTLKELVKSAGGLGIIQLASEGFGLDRGASCRELDIRVFHVVISARDSAGPDGE